MASTLFPLVCLCVLFMPTVFGVAITLIFERWLGVVAYVLGWLVPIIALITLYILYDIWIRATPCEPTGSLACGEPLAYALILFVAVLCLTALANALAQVAAFFFLQGRRRARVWEIGPEAPQ